jgi:hypothetical protein
METAEKHWDLLNEDVMGITSEVHIIMYVLSSILMLISNLLMQNHWDTPRNVGTSSPEMIFFSSLVMTARTSSQPPGRFATTWPSRRAALAKFASLFRGWMYFRSW